MTGAPATQHTNSPTRPPWPGDAPQPRQPWRHSNQCSMRLFHVEHVRPVRGQGFHQL